MGNKEKELILWVINIKIEKNIRNRVKSTIKNRSFLRQLSILERITQIKRKRTWKKDEKVGIAIKLTKRKRKIIRNKRIVI